MLRQEWETASSEPSQLGVSCDLDATPSREVRRLLRELLTGRDGIMVDDAVLVTDELVTNALRHGRGPRTCQLALIDQGRCLRIEVDDASPAQPKVRTPDRSGGRGLVLVDQLSSSWGVRNHTDSKTVWAELALDRTGSSGHARHLRVAAPRR